MRRDDPVAFAAASGKFKRKDARRFPLAYWWESSRRIGPEGSPAL
jgi:hypothetical protein